MSIGDPDLDALMASTLQLRTESPPARSFNSGVDASEGVDANEGVASSATLEFTQGNVPFSHAMEVYHYRSKLGTKNY